MAGAGVVLFLYILGPKMWTDLFLSLFGGCRIQIAPARFVCFQRSHIKSIYSKCRHPWQHLHATYTQCSVFNLQGPLCGPSVMACDKRWSCDNRWCCDKRWSCDDRWCSECEMWLNGKAQYSEHLRGKKHRKNMKRMPVARGSAAVGASLPTKMVVPEGTVFIIEQSAILKDATSSYLLSLYAKSMLRARL